MRYQTIVVDPPWAYRQKWADFSKSMWTKNRKIRGSDGLYGSMDMDALKALPVGSWADDNAHLYLWVTNSFMVEGHELARAWGFEPKTIITWVKNQIGMGFYFRGTTEHVLFCVKGSLKGQRRDLPTHLIAPRGRHSEKPDAFYDMVETMSPGPYLDVFARRQRFNWDTYGNECFTPDDLLSLTAVAKEGL